MEDRIPVYIIGHKNPDTDSICSAIAYADLKNKVHGGGYYAARAGQINQETQYVLKFFQTPAPQYIEDVMTEVSDIEIRKTKGVSGKISLKKAWNMMRELDVVTLPITSEKDELLGLITIGDIATAYMDVYDNCILSTAGTSYKNILETLEATMVVGDEDATYKKGEVIKVSRTIQKMAQEHNCNIIVTPYDTFTAARMINQSMPIEYFMKRNDLTTFHLADKTEDIKGVMGKKRHRDFPILDENDRYVGMISRRNLLNLRKKQLILVDHNEVSQTVDGIEFAHILEIIDHHRIGTLETLEPVLFRNQPLGCTATIIYQMYQEHGVEIPKNIAGLLMAAIISDTLMFRSPTCTPVDQKAAEDLSEICGVEIEEFAVDMFGAGSDLSSKEPKEIFNQDLKRFEVGDIEFVVSQINSMNSIELQEIKEKIVPYLEEVFEGLGVSMAFVMLTNIVKESTELLCFGEKSKDVVKEAFQLSGDMKRIILKGLVSRKKQLIPSLVSILQQ